jgi:tetratricopeptide (TPR) repeat protein
VHALREAGRREEADRLLTESLELVPWHPLLLTARAAAATARGDFALATADLERARALRPWDLRMRAVAADARLGRSPDEASRSEALDVLAAIHEAKDFRLLSQAARAFTKRDRFFLAVLAARARRVAAERPDEAVALVLAPVDGLSPDDAGFFEEASKVLQSCGREDQSRVLLGRSQGLRARDALAAGDVDRARRLAVRAAERDPLPEHRVVEALCLARTSDRRAVREALAAAAALGPLDADAIRADPAFAALLPDPDLELLLSRGRGSEGLRKP